MKIILFDRNPDVCIALEEAFAGVPEVEVLLVEGLAELPQVDALATPGNSFGVMTHGMDLAVREALGQGIQDDIQHYILSLGNPLPVGQAISLELKAPDRFRHIIYAPTMYIPCGAVLLDLCYAMQAIVYHACTQGYERLALPGLGTGTGGMPPNMAAVAMRAGYDAAMRVFTYLQEHCEEDQ